MLSSPVRSIRQVYSRDGELLAEHDTFGNYAAEQLIEFAKLCREKSDLAIEDIYLSWANS